MQATSTDTPISAGTTAAPDNPRERGIMSPINIRSLQNVREHREKAKQSRVEYDPSSIDLNLI